MAILNLTGQSYFPQIGTIRKGDEKTDPKKPGKDLDYFRFDTEDADALKAFREYYGNEPKAIRVFLPFNDVDSNFEAWQEEWSASSLKHRCDSKTVVLWLNGKSYSREPKPCPYIDQFKADPNFKGGCKPSGRLKIIIPELRRMAYVAVLTTSKHDIMTLDANLRALQNARGSLKGIPLILRRVEKEISTPRGDGSRARVTKSLLMIEAQPEWVALQLQAMAANALPLLEQGEAPHPLRLVPAPSDIDVETVNGIDASYVQQIVALYKECGWSNIDNVLKRKGVDRIELLSQEDADQIINWLKAKRDAIAATKSQPVIAGEVIEALTGEPVEESPKPFQTGASLDQWKCTEETGSRSLALNVLSVWKEAGEALGLTDEQLREEMGNECNGITSRKELSEAQANQFISFLRAYIDAVKAKKAQQ